MSLVVVPCLAVIGASKPEEHGFALGIPVIGYADSGHGNGKGFGQKDQGTKGERLVVVARPAVHGGALPESTINSGLG